ncbi:hypothetical protein GCM10010404_47370 [Nonomuraea africana]
MAVMTHSPISGINHRASTTMGWRWDQARILPNTPITLWKAALSLLPPGGGGRCTTQVARHVYAVFMGYAALFGSGSALWGE